jgi:hypothetical protein
MSVIAGRRPRVVVGPMGVTPAWAVGLGGIVHYDGMAWSIADGGATAGLLAVWGSGPHDVRVVGTGGAILRHSSP